MYLRRATAVDVLIGPFLDLTDAATAETGESPSVKLSKNGQTMAAKSDATTPVHDADGYYNCELDATDTNTAGNLVLTVAASANALAVRHEYQVVEETTYDALYATSPDGFDADGRVDVGAVLGTAQTAGDIVGSFPTNFSDLSIAATTGRVDIGTVVGIDATPLGWSLEMIVIGKVKSATDGGKFKIETTADADLPVHDLEGRAVTFRNKAGVANRASARVILEHTITSGPDEDELDVGFSGQTVPSSDPFPNTPNVDDEFLIS